MSDIFYKYQKEEEEMLNRYMKAYFSLEHYYTIINKLKELKAFGRDNSFLYGDADVYVHIETIEDTECLVIHNAVSCYDRPACIIQVKDFGDIEGYPRFSIKAICTEMVSKKKYDDRWKDRRDYKVVGYDVIKEKGFRYLYGDSRDVEWAFNSSFLTDGVYENLSRDNTLFILQEMDYLYNNINELRQ